MRKRNLVFILVLFFSVSAFSAEKSKKLADTVYRVMLGGKQVGRMHWQVQEVIRDGNKFYHESMTGLIKVVAGGITHEQKISEKTVSDENWNVVSRREKTEAGPQVTEKWLEKDKETLTVAVSVSGQVNRKSFPRPEGGVQPSFNPLMFSGDEFKKQGFTKSHKVVSFDARCVETETLTCLGAEQVNWNGKSTEAAAYRIETSVTGQKIKAYLFDGRFVIFEINGIRFEAVRGEEGGKDFEAGEISSWIKVKPAAKISPKSPEAFFEVKVKGGETEETLKKIENCEYQHLARKNGRWILKLKAISMAKDRPSFPPAVPDEVKKFLEPGALIQSSAEPIRKKAREIIGEEKDFTKVAGKVTLWVYRNLKKEESAAGKASALETLRAGKGNCNEHSILSAALFRAVGIPAREATGIMVMGNRAGYHSWTEIWAGRWIPVDTTRPRLGAPPCYLMLARGEDDLVSSKGANAVGFLYGNIELKFLGEDYRE